jgi:molybdate transport system substrate-binding protein
MRLSRRLFLCVSLSAVLARGAKTQEAAGANALVIFAAASLRNALDAVVAAFVRETGRSAPVISYAASNALVRQIEQGAPADIFFSADLDWMAYAAARGLIRPETRLLLLANRLALIAPKESRLDLALVPGVDLAGALGAGRLAMGHVEAVPAGKYGKAALEALGAWPGVKDRIAQAENVRAALLFVSRGEAALGIVYATDAAADPAVRIVAVFPETSHPPILYPVAVTAGSINQDSALFLDYLKSAGAAAIFTRHGFVVSKMPRKGA